MDESEGDEEESDGSEVLDLLFRCLTFLTRGWERFLEGVSGEHLKAFFTRIIAKQGGGYTFCWFDGVETEVLVPGTAMPENVEIGDMG